MKYIDASKIKLDGRQFKTFCGTVYIPVGEVTKAIASAPSEDVIPLSQGKWIRTVPTSTKSYRQVCSQCHKVANMIAEIYDYCPHCAARMAEYEE